MTWPDGQPARARGASAQRHDAATNSSAITGGWQTSAKLETQCAGSLAERKGFEPSRSF